MIIGAWVGRGCSLGRSSENSIPLEESVIDLLEVMWTYSESNDHLCFGVAENLLFDDTPGSCLD